MSLPKKIELTLFNKISPLYNHDITNSYFYKKLGKKSE